MLQANIANFVQPNTKLLEVLLLVLNLRERVKSGTSLIAYTLRLAFSKNRPFPLIVQTILDNARDNRPVMSEILGEDLLAQVESLDLQCFNTVPKIPGIQISYTGRHVIYQQNKTNNGTTPPANNVKQSYGNT